MKPIKEPHKRGCKKFLNWRETWIFLTVWWKWEDLLLDCEDSEIWARPARARACARNNACILCNHSAVRFLSMCPLTNAWSFTNPFNALNAFLALKTPKKKKKKIYSTNTEPHDYAPIKCTINIIGALLNYNQAMVHNVPLH